MSTRQPPSRMNYSLSSGLQPQSNKVFDSYVEIENKNRIVDNYSTMAEKKEQKIKRTVDFASSHSERDSEEGPVAAYPLEGSAVSELYKDDRIPSFMRYLTITT